MKWLARLLIASCFLPAGVALAQTTAHMPYGDVRIYEPAGKVASVALFLSGDGGWNQGVIPMARKLTEQNALVIGVNTPKFLNYLDQGDGACTDPTDELLKLAQNVMSSYKLAKDDPPVVLGYSSGATVAYTVLVQAKAGSFAGGIGLGFCPDLETRKPMCGGAGLTYVKNGKGPGFVYDAAPLLSAPFVALQGEQDQVCNPVATDAFIARMKGASVIDLPKVGHGFSVPKNWMPQYVDAYRRIVTGKIP
jgi:type IV secretory pathway VirJ component